MTFLKLLLSGALICTFAMAIPVDKNLNITRLDGFKYSLLDSVPLHYDINYKVIMDILSGEVNINIYTHAMQNINLTASNFINIMEANLRRINNREFYVPKSYVKGEIVSFKFDDVILPGLYNLYVKFHTSINSLRDFFQTSYTHEKNDEGWFVATGFQPRKIRRIFSFWGKPEFRVSYNISIIHNKKYNVLSNMPIRDSKLLSDDMMLTYFHETPSMSIDNVAFVVSDLHQIVFSETVSAWCRMQVVPYVKSAQYIAENVTAYLKNYWSNSKNIFERTFLSFERKVDYIIIPNYQDEVKQTLGFVFFK